MISGSVDSTSPGGGLMSRGVCYRQTERIFFNSAQFAGLFVVVVLFFAPESFFFLVHTAIFTKSQCVFGKAFVSSVSDSI